MLLEILLFCLLGIAAGTFTGLTPGIHINLVGSFLVFLSGGFLSFLNPIYLVVFIVAMSITHTFTDFIPSILLGCPNEDTALSVLPGHKMLKKGLGYEAIKLSAYGGLAAIFITILLTLPSISLLSKLYSFLQSSKLIIFILIGISLALIFSDDKKISSFFVFLITGILGLIVLNIGPGINEPLLPLLSGLFGASMLVISIRSKTKIPKQNITKEKIRIKELVKPIVGATLAAPLLSMFPGVGSGQSAILGSLIAKPDNKEFIVLLGATNTLVMGLSFIFFYSILKTRTGSAAAIQNLIGNLDTEILILILLIIFLGGIFSFFLTLFLGKFFSKKIHLINYSLLSKIILIFLGAIVLLISGFLGFLILIVSAITGVYCISLNVRRTQMMGCLLLPTIILYLL